MPFSSYLGTRAIQDVIAAYPEIGAILEKHDIGSVTCKAGICLLKMWSPSMAWGAMMRLALSRRLLLVWQ